MNLQSFSFNTIPVRVVLQQDGPWWMARDVCEALGLQGDPGQHTRRLDDDEKGLILVQTPGGPQQQAAVNEPGLYSLILRSDKPAARAFKRWVTHVVLPNLRQGSGLAGTSFRVPETYAAALRLAADLDDQRRTLACRVEAQAQDLAILEPKASFCDAVARASDAHSINEAAKILGTGQNRLFAWLQTQGYIYRAGRELQPYQQHVDAGLFKVVEEHYEDTNKRDRIYAKVLITGKGMVTIQRRLAPEVPGALIRPQHQPGRA